MALSTTIKTLLNKFADSQPALRLAGEPLNLSNPNLGDVLDAAIDAASTLQAADGVTYVPTTSADWNGDPADVGEALDRLAALGATLNAAPVP